jgi:hypothetical protein
MADEQLRMTAEVVDKFSKPLRDLQKALREVKQPPAAREMREQFAGVSKAASEAASQIRGDLTSAIGGLGIASLGATGAIAAVVAAVRGMSSSTAELKAFSRETGLSTQRLRELEALGDRFQIAPDAVRSGVQTFSRQLYDIRRRYGEVYNWLKDQPGFEVFAEQLFDSKSTDEAIGRALGMLRKIPDAIQQQKFAEKLFGSGIFGRFGAGTDKEFQNQIRDVRKALGDLSEDAAEAAEKFERSLKSLGDTLRGIRDEIGAGALPELNKQLADLREKLTSQEFKAFSTWLSHEVGGAARDVAGLFKEIVGDVKWLAEHAKPAANAALGNGLDGKSGGNYGTAGPIGGVNGPIFDRRLMDLTQKQKLLGILEENIERKEGAGEDATDSRRKRDQLIDEIRKLRETMERAARDRDDATVQKQSFDGPGLGGGGARIWNASLGGGGGFGLPRMQYGGGAGGGGSARDTDASGPMLKWDGGRGGSAKAASRAAMMSHAMDQLRKEGVPESNLRAAAAHLVGQADMESGLDPNKSHDGGTGYGIYGARLGRRTQMLAWLKANGYAANSAEGQMRYMAHEAMSKKYPRTRGILMNANPNAMGRDSWAVTHEFEAPKVDNDRSGAVARAYRVGPRSSEPDVQENASRPDSPISRTEAPGRPDSPLSRTEAPGRPDSPLSRMGDSLMLRSAAAQKVEGNASLRIDFNGLPRGTRLSTEASGMFRDVTLNRGKQMPDGGEDV